jgi:hypothetical protein
MHWKCNAYSLPYLRLVGGMHPSITPWIRHCMYRPIYLYLHIAEANESNKANLLKSL